VLVKIIEIDAERRRLSLSIKRVEPDDEVQPLLVLEGMPVPRPAPAAPAEDAADEGEVAPDAGDAEALPEEAVAEAAVDEAPAAEAEPIAETAAADEAAEDVHPEPEPAREPTLGLSEDVFAEDESAPEPEAEAEEVLLSDEDEADAEADAEAEADLEPIAEDEVEAEAAVPDAE
jgi:small subunit ribosomal protein S1